jgi:hypothetical protein
MAKVTISAIEIQRFPLDEEMYELQLALTEIDASEEFRKYLRPLICRRIEELEKAYVEIGIAPDVARLADMKSYLDSEDSK